MGTVTLGRADVLRLRFHAHELDRAPGTATSASDVALLDHGVQDTGTDGAAWALANRGAPPIGLDGCSLAWTIRGAPHAYRHADLSAVATATAPYSEADASKRVFDAAKPLKTAGIAVLDALVAVAEAMRARVVEPTPKGDVSAALTERLPAPYLRTCRPCGTTHIFELPFRLAALQAGLELVPATSPPVLRRIPGFRAPMYRHLGGEARPQVDVIRNALRFYGPARARDVAAFLDAPVKQVQANWPTDAVEIAVDGDAGPPRFALTSPRPSSASTDTARTVRLLGPFDPYLQLRDRELLVSDEAHRKELWPVLGRPGAIAADGEVLGTWRPRASGRKVTVVIRPWGQLKRQDRALVEEQAARLATHRGAALAGVVDA